MRPLQKLAIFNLVVVFCGFLILLPLTYLLDFSRAVGIALPLTVGATGAGVLVMRRKKKEGYKDERDRSIEISSSLSALWMTFFYFVACGYYILFATGDGPVERQLLSFLIFSSVLVLIVVSSVVAILLYGWGDERGTRVLDVLRIESDLQGEAALLFLAVLAIMSALLFAFPLEIRNVSDWAKAIAFFLAAGILFFALPVGMTASEQDERDTDAVVSSRTTGWRWLAVSFLAGLAVIGSVYASRGAGALDPGWFLLAGYCAFCVGMVSFLASIVVRVHGH